MQSRILSQVAPHSARTALAALVSLGVARLFRLPEAYWSAVTTMIVMQSTLGAAMTISRQRFAGTLLGAATGALIGTYFRSNMLVFSAGVFLMGLLCGAIHLERNAFRFAGITLAIVMLVMRTGPVWIIAIHRFLEVSAGIAVGILVTAVWPERQAILKA